MSSETTINPTFETPEFNLPALAIWVIYNHPKDMPDCYVGRMFLTDKPTDTFVTGKNLDEVRSKLPADLSKIERHEDDDPVIVEVWL